MTYDYDPFSHEAMSDPHSVYKNLRKEDGPHFIEKYNAWALTSFDDLWNASILHEKDITFTDGQPLVNVLLGEPVPHTFTSMDGREHRKWRSVLRGEYTPGSVVQHADRFRNLCREVLKPLLEKGEFDVYSEYFCRVISINAGYNLGLSVENALHWRHLIDETMHREMGQVGTVSERNLKAGMELRGSLQEYVLQLRSNPELAKGQTKAYLEAEIDGVKADDEAMVNFLIVMLTVGSGTTPNVCTGAVYYLGREAEQKTAVLANLDLVDKLFMETARYDQPTNMLCRRAVNDFELGGKKIKAGQALLYIYASANRDEAEFQDSEKFDIFRESKRDASFGAGGHKCLGMHMATLMGTTALRELFDAVGDYQVLEDQCGRAYGEFLSGFTCVPIKVATQSP